MRLESRYREKVWEHELDFRQNIFLLELQNMNWAGEGSGLKGYGSQPKNVESSSSEHNG